MMKPKRRPSRGTWLLPGLVAASVAACGDGVSANQKGDLAAERTGDLSHPLAPRQVPDAELSARCGEGEVSDVGLPELQRLPFTQQVAPTEANIVFQSTQPTSKQLRVTTLDGALVETVDSVADPSVSSGSQQLAKLAGLEPGSGYCYELVGLTAPAGFKTAPALAAAASPVRFAAFGDSGSGSRDQLALRDQLSTVPFDFIVHTGDLAYGGGTGAQLERSVFRVYAPLLRSFPFYPVLGNHDYETEDGLPFLRAFLLPENGDDERYYSFDWGGVHFVGLDTEQIGSRQAGWLDADLKQNHLPWTVVFGHKPPFSSGEHGSSDEFRAHFVPVLERYTVTLVLSGHDHDYERSKPMNGVTYVVTGGGGVGTRPVGTSSFTAFSEAVIHFVFVEVTEEQLMLHAIDGTGREFDQLLIERDTGA
jgi:hypothetical protein